MATTNKGIYAGRDPRDVPTYGIKDAARFLIIPSATLHAWVAGQSYVTQREGKKRAQPVIELAGRSPPLLSFWNLAEAYVLAGIRRHHGVSLQSARRALNYVGRRLGHKRPLIEQDFLTNGADLFVEKLVQLADQDRSIGALVNVSRGGQLAARVPRCRQRLWPNDSGQVTLLRIWQKTFVLPPRSYKTRLAAGGGRTRMGDPNQGQTHWTPSA